VGKKEDILENLVYVGYALEKWLTVEKFPELKKVVGNYIKYYGSNSRHDQFNQ